MEAYRMSVGLQFSPAHISNELLLLKDVHGFM